MAKIVIQLKGGLGNQMFQYALGRAISLRKNCDFYLDLTQFLNNASPGRRYMLDSFNIQAKIAKEKERRSVDHILWEKKYFEYQPEVFSDLSPGETRWYKGSWQNPKYFKTIYHLVDDFTVKSPSQEYLMIKNEIESINRDYTTVAIHFRRGDFLNEDTARFHGNLNKYYYSSAIKELSDIIENSMWRVLLFSEDARYLSYLATVDWIRYQSLPIYQGNMSDVEHLMLMSQCHHNIIANSSYSWWSAYLNQNKEKCVIAPELWIKEPHHRGIHPEGWVAISNKW